MPAGTSIWTFAGLTAAVGMGVVFTALFVLSTYMHLFKSVIARVEIRRAEKVPAPPPKAKTRPAVKPVPTDGSPVVPTEDARVAAAIAVGLSLAGAGGGPGGDVAAAIAVAMTLHWGRSTQLEGTSVRPTSGWKLAGRMEAMTSRLKRHERPLRR